MPELPATMRAWVVEDPGPVASTNPLRLVELPVPEPAEGELLVKVLACGVCRTDLHLAEGDLEPHAPGIVPGHEAVGEVVAVGEGVSAERVGAKVGVAWLRSTCGRCVACRRGAENLCRESTYTGWDAHGAFAEYTTVLDAFVYDLPDGFSDLELAPLLCAGIIGYRALQKAELLEGGNLGIYGFGASAHLCAQVAVAEGANVFVMTRSITARALAIDVGAVWAGGATYMPIEPLNSAILFAPVGDFVPVALEALDDGGTLAIAGIHLTDIPSLNYQQHLFRERGVRSVTANTREDGRAFLSAAARHRIRVMATAYAFEQADIALRDVDAGDVLGAAVLVMP